MEQEFVRQLRFRFVDLAGSVGSGRAFAHRNNPSTRCVVTWSVNWARPNWDANNWAFAQGLFRNREFYVPYDSVEPAEGQPRQFGATFRVSEEWVGRFAEMFAERYLPGASQLNPELARVDQEKWHGQIKGL